MPGDFARLAGLLGLGHGGGGGGGHHHGGGRGGGGWGWGGPGYLYDPFLVAENVSTILPGPAPAGAAPSAGARIYADAIRMKESAEHGDNSLQEVFNGDASSKQILHEPDLPKATEGFMWVFNSGPSKRSGAPGNWIMYVRAATK